jgi:hypothetical protein
MMGFVRVQHDVAFAVTRPSICREYSSQTPFCALVVKAL